MTLAIFDVILSLKFHDIIGALAIDAIKAAREAGFQISDTVPWVGFKAIDPVEQVVFPTG